MMTLRIRNIPFPFSPIKYILRKRMDTVPWFWDTIAKFYSKQKISDPEAYDFKLKRTQKYLSSDSKVLEFGCGTGSTALIHAPKVREILAIDSSKKMIEIANLKLKKSNLTNLKFKQATLFELTEPQSSFDAVLGLNVLHLVPKTEETIKKSFDLLKKGGLFITSTACLGEGFFLKIFLPIFGKLGLLPKVQFFSDEALKSMMRNVGSEILEAHVPGKDKAVHFIIAQK